MNNQRTKFLIAAALIPSLFFTNCASNRIITYSQLEEDKEQYNRIINRKIVVYKKGDKIITGYLNKVAENSILISQTKDREPDITISKDEVEKIKVLNDVSNTIVLAVITLSVVFIVFVSAKGITAGASKTN